MAGPVHRVPDRAASVPSAWTPAALTDLQLWLDADDTATLWEDTAATTAATNNGLVARWDDKSGNDYHAFERVDSYYREPTRIDGSVGGNTALLFDAIENAMRTSCGMSQTTNWMIATVFVPNSAGNTRRILQSVDKNALIHATRNTGNIYLDGFIRTDSWASAGDTNLACLVAADSGNFIFYGDGTNLTTSTRANAAWGTICIGRDGAYGEGADAYVCEVLAAYTNDELERQKLEGYLAHKWGLEANLPSDHPYKASAP